MFGNSYQNSPCFQVWDSKMNQDKNQAYRHLFRVYPATINKHFDKQIKSYIYTLQGQIAKICLPTNDQKQLSLHQKYLVLHIYIPIGCSWAMQLGITDVNGTKRRINFTTGQGKQETKYFSLRYPLDHVSRGNWVFLGFDIYSFMEAFKDQVFRSLDHISISSNCRLRRIFTMKEWNQWQIPKNFWFHSEIQQQLELIQYQTPILPKISLSKNINMNNSSEPVHSLYEKLTPNKRQSKIALVKSQISPSQGISKSKVYNQKNYHPNRSPGKPVSLEPITKKKISQKNQFSSKLRLNSMRDQFFQQNNEFVNLNLYNGQKQSQGLTKNMSSKIRNNKSIKTNNRSPKIQKSFQEDEALNISQHEQEDIGDTSHQSYFENKNQKNVVGSRTKKPEVLKNIEQNQVMWSDNQQYQQQFSISQAQHSKNIIQQKSVSPVKNGNKQLQSKIHTNVKNGKHDGQIGKTVISQQNKEVIVGVQILKDNQIQLIYDEMVGFYYHPQTHTYYDIKKD